MLDVSTGRDNTMMASSLCLDTFRALKENITPESEISAQGRAINLINQNPHLCAVKRACLGDRVCVIYTHPSWTNTDLARWIDPLKKAVAEMLGEEGCLEVRSVCPTKGDDVVWRGVALGASDTVPEDTQPAVFEAIISALQ